MWLMCLLVIAMRAGAAELSNPYNELIPVSRIERHSKMLYSTEQRMRSPEEVL